MIHQQISVQLHSHEGNHKTDEKKHISMHLIIAFYHCLSSSEKGLKNSGLSGDLNPELCDTGAVLYQFSY